MEEPEIVEVNHIACSGSGSGPVALKSSTGISNNTATAAIATVIENDNATCSTPEKFLNLFGTEMAIGMDGHGNEPVSISGLSGAIEIGDEVTVPSSPLTFHNYTDHSYFSSPSPRLVTPPSSIQFNDCRDVDSISISDPGLPLPPPDFHIHDLFDLASEYPYQDQSFDNFLRHDNNIDLQEQIIESGHNTRDSENFLNMNPQNNFSWMFPCDIPLGGGGKGKGMRGSESYECDDNDNTNEENSDSSCDDEEMADLDNDAAGKNSSSSHNFGSGSGSGNKEENFNNQTENQNKRTTTNNTSHHHTGPFPHTFIAIPGDRRIRFCFGLQTIVSKIRALMSRTGAITNFKAEFEGHTFTLENVDQLGKFSSRTQKRCSGNSSSKKRRKCVDTNMDLSNCRDGDSNQSQGAGAGADDDHRYAAMILTQTESSSSVRDHQYNEVSTTNCVEDKPPERGSRRSSIEKSYIRTRYARERWLRKVATTIYTKMQRLINRTGAKMTLIIEYEGLLVTPKNYKELEHLLGTYRPTMKKFNTKIVIQNHGHNHSGSSTTTLSKYEMENAKNNVSSSQDTGTDDRDQREDDQENKSKSLMRMKVSFPRSKQAINQSLRIEFLDTTHSPPRVSRSRSPAPSIISSGNRDMTGTTTEIRMTAVGSRSDHDYQSQSEPDNFHSEFFSEAETSVSVPVSISVPLTTVSTTNASAIASSSKVVQRGPLSSNTSTSTSTLLSQNVVRLNNTQFRHHHKSPSSEFTLASNSSDGGYLVCENSGGSNNVNATTNSSLGAESSKSVQKSVDAHTITDPRCELCGKSTQSSSTLIGNGSGSSSSNRYPLWIRCANPLCQYLVHPSCIGFFVVNAQQLQLLPPFFCPGHRDDP